jgi:hypothetical protein
MKKIVFAMALLVSATLAFANTNSSKGGDPNYKHQAGHSSQKGKVVQHPVVVS